MLCLALFCFLTACATAHKPQTLPIDPGPRQEIYPIPFWPRMYRWQMMTKLQEYLDDEKSASLAAFSWWYKKWKTEFPDEAKTSYDFQLADAKVDVDVRKEDVLKNFQLTSEAETLGPLAAKVLDQLKLGNWKEEYEGGVSPLAIIASIHPAKFQPNDPALQTEFLNQSVKVMEILDKDGKIDSVIQLLSSKKTERYVIGNDNATIGSYNDAIVFRSFFQFQDLVDVRFASIHSPLELKGPQYTLSLAKDDVWITAQSTPCDLQYSTILMTDPKVNLQKKKLQKDGITWHCLK